MAEQDTDYEKIKEYLKELKQTDSPKDIKNLQNEIITEAVPLVRKIASHLARRSTDPIEDILQVGILGR